MNNLKYFLMLFAGMVMFACSSSEEDSTGGNNNNNSGGTPQPPQTETSVTVEKLPEGVELIEGTIQLNNIQIKNIKGVDGDNSTLTFSANLPSEHIPQKGEIILQYSTTEELPYGFLGRVTEVTTTGDAIVVETEAPALNEAFEKLVIEYNMNNIQTMSRTEVEDSFHIDENNYLRFTRELKLEDIDLSCELSLGVNIASNIHIDTNSNIDNQQYEFGMMAEATINYAPSIEGEYSIMRDFGNGINIRLPYASPAIMGAIQFSWVSEAKGSISSEHTITAKADRVFCINKNGTTTQTSSDNIGEASMGVEYESDLHLDGELFSALGIRLDLRLFGRKELSVGVGTEIGPRASAKIDISSEDSNLYEAFKDECVTLQGLLKTKAYAQAKLFSFDSEWSKEFGDGWTFWEASRYVFPEFKEPMLDIVNGKAECSTTVKRGLLFKSEIGIAQYNTKKELVNTSTQTYLSENDFEENTLKTSFTHGEDYTYWSFIKLGERIIRCKQLPRNDIVGTWKLIYASRYVSDTGEFIEEHYNDNEGWYNHWTFFENGELMSYEANEVEYGRDSHGSYYIDGNYLKCVPDGVSYNGWIPTIDHLSREFLIINVWEGNNYVVYKYKRIDDFDFIMRRN